MLTILSLSKEGGYLPARSPVLRDEGRGGILQIDAFTILRILTA
jgi:hypothetical protein